MIKRTICFIIMLLTIQNMVYSMSEIVETFMITNYTDEEITVIFEFQDGIIDPVDPNWGDVQVGGIEITLKYLSAEGSYVVSSEGGYFYLYESYPFGASNRFLPLDPWDYLDQVPFMDKLNAIFKRLEIVSEEGRITLEDINNILVKKIDSGGERAYDIEVFYDTFKGFDVEYRLGSEY